MVRHLSPALLIACAALGGLYLSLALHPLLRSLLAMLPVAAGIALIHIEKLRGFAAAILLIGAGWAVGTGLGLQLGLRKAGSYTAIPAERVRAFTGYLLQDSSRTKTGKSIHRVALAGVVGPLEAGGARGEVTVFDPKASRYLLGQRLHIEGGLNRKDSPSREAFTGTASTLRPVGFQKPWHGWRASVWRAVAGGIEHIGPPASSLLMALFLGDRSDLPAELESGFERTGTLHLLALSGLHVGIVYALVLVVLRVLPRGLVRWSVGCIAVFFYLFLVGPRASLLRASLFVFFAGLARVLDRDREPLNVLGIVLLLMLLTAPATAATLSFQLSFLAMFGILVWGDAVARRLRGWLPAFLRLPLSYSVGAQAATLPLIAAHFGMWYPVALVATVVQLPLITLFLWTGILFLPLVALPVPALRGAAGWALRYLYEAVHLVNRVFGAVPGVEVSWRSWYGWLILIFFGCWLYLSNQRERRGAAL
jgi:competence protein ComEC